jgi:hypothetical protein
MGLGFRRWNLDRTAPDALARSPWRPSGSGVHAELATTTFSRSGAVVRCRPVDDASGFVDVPGSDPAGGPPPSAGRQPEQPPQAAAADEQEALLLAYEGQGSGATQPPQAGMSGLTGARSCAASSGTASDRDMLNAAFYPTMPTASTPTAAHNAAHCEPVPGDWLPELAMKPADAASADEPLDALHAAGGAPTEGGAATCDANAAAHGGASQGGRGEPSASKPAGDPEAIKRVVNEETLHGEPGSRTAS